MPFSDIIAGLLEGLPAKRAQSDEEIERFLAGREYRRCACGEQFLPRGTQERCGRCSDFRA